MHVLDPDNGRIWSLFCDIKIPKVTNGANFKFG